MRNLLLVALVAFAAGAIASAMIIQHQTGVQIASLEEELGQLRTEAGESAKKVEAAESRADFLAAENASLKEDLANRKASPQPALMPPAEEAAPPAPPEGEEESGDRESDRRRGPGRGGPFWRGGEEMSEEERAEREARWRDFMARRQAERDAAFQAEMDAAPDAATRERLAAIQDYRASMGELRDAMRNAETDEERDQLREMMMANAETLRDMTLTQRDQMVRNLASDFGIKSENKQQAFIQALNELQTSPVLNSGFGFGGGRGSGRGGPR